MVSIPRRRGGHKRAMGGAVDPSGTLRGAALYL